MVVAVIDDGIDVSRLSHPGSLIHDLIVESGGVVRPRKAGDFFGALHGTRCAQIIEAYAKGTEFISLCIFDKEALITDCKKLVAALDWCRTNKVRLIHMSVGTRLLADYGILHPAAVRLVRQGGIIVAAANNAGTFTMPACLGGVLGVEMDASLTDDAYRYQEFKNGIYIAASSNHRFFTEEAGLLSPAANSFAAPAVTAAVCKLLDRSPELCIPQLFTRLLPQKQYHALHPDFLDAALLLNWSDSQLLRDCITFSCTEISDITEIRPSDEKKCLIFLPGKDDRQNERVCDFIERHTERFYGFVYGGQETDVPFAASLEKLRERMFIWQEGDCGMAFWQRKAMFGKTAEDAETQTEATPCVWIQTTTGEGVKLACRLQRQFCELGYQCVAASDWDCAYLYGLEYIPKNSRREQALRYLEEVFTPDLIILTERETNKWEFETGEVYCIGENDFANEGLCEKIIAYFS